MERSGYLFIGLCFAAAFTTLLTAPTMALAVPAAPDEFILEQPDGTTFKAHKWGDENRSGWETVDGYTIVFESMMNRWTYAVQDMRGNLVGSSYVVGKDTPPPGLKPQLRPKAAPGPVMKSTKEKTLKPSAPAKPLSAPSMSLVVSPTGTGYVPVILMNFSDRTTTITQANFNSLLFSHNTGSNSMKDYYEEVSYGRFTVDPGTPGGVLGWYTAANTHNYYGPQSNNSNLSPYVQVGPHTGDLVWEAAAAADAAGVDFTQYDSEGDCYVDVIAVIHQGTGKEASTNMYDIWSHRSSLNDLYQSIMFNGSPYTFMSHPGEYVSTQACPGHPGEFMKVNDYIIMPEKQGTAISTIGVFAHEYGHSLGLPDLYDTDYYSAGIGRWSIMAGGSWNGVTRSGDRPAHMDAWCKYVLGWVTPTQVTSAISNQPIAAAAISADVYKLLNGIPAVSGEYFLVENRQKVGFDAGLPGAGLLIWHIDESQASKSNDCTIFPVYYRGTWDWFSESLLDVHNVSNCSPYNHYHVAVVQADNQYYLEGGKYYFSGPYFYWSYNQGDAGDPFPGSTLNRWFYDTSTRFNNSNLYDGSTTNGTQSNVIVADISNSGLVMTASMAAQPLVHIPLETALDDPALGTTLSFSTGGSTGWYGQYLVNKFGGSSAKSGDISNSQSSMMQTTVTGPGSIAFLWKVSSQPSYDYVSFKINGVEKARISGSVDWQPKGFILSAGTSTLTWTYVKNGTAKQGMDAAWVDHIQLNTITAVTLASPNGGETFASGSSQSISWSAPIAAEKYKLWYSLDSGVTWVSITPDYVTGTNYSWTVPAPNGNKPSCKVKVTAYNSANVVVGTDVSNAPFAIEVLKVNAPNGSQVLASGATTTIDYTINATISTVRKVEFAYTVDNGASWKLITALTGTVTPGTYTQPWSVPVQAANRTACKVKVTLRNAANAVIGTDTSDTNFIVEVVKVNSPNGGEVLASGTTTTIGYTINTTMSTVRKVELAYTVDNGLTWKLITALTGTVTPGTYTQAWSVPIPAANKPACKVKVTLKNAANAVIGTDMSDKTFTIEVVKVTSPNGGEMLTSSMTTTTIDYTINATVSPVTSVLITYTIDNGVTWKTAVITGPIGTTLGLNSTTWTLPGVTASKTKCKVKVTLKSAASAIIGTDMSDDVFTISP